jgi:putative ABC transport system permease protein
VLLTLLGAVLALVLSVGALHLISGSGLLPFADLRLNLPVFAAGVLAALAFGILSGVYPAWRMSRLHPARALGGRSR